MTEKSAHEIVGVRIDPRVRRAARSGDNWCLTWADDGHQYTSCDDGWGWDYLGHAPEGAWSPDVGQANNRIWRIIGGPEDMDARVVDGYPAVPWPDNWYGYGIVSAGGVLYHFISQASGTDFGFPFQGVKLVWSADHGDTWYLHDGRPLAGLETASGDAMLFLHEGAAWGLAHIEVLQAGQDNTAAQDAYLYLYSPYGRRDWNRLTLARVPVDRVRDRAAYEFFREVDPAGEAHWTPRIDERGAVHEFPAGYGWYSWLPSVVYIEPLDRYLMVASGTGRDGSGMHDLPGSLGMYTASRPWGPWREVLWLDDWTGDDPGNRLYQPKLSPKWISPTGEGLELVYSDARDQWGCRYRWNQQHVELVLA